MNFIPMQIYKIQMNLFIGSFPNQVMLGNLKLAERYAGIALRLNLILEAELTLALVLSKKC